MKRVPLFDARREYARSADRLQEAAARVLSSGSYILGDEVARFEGEVAEFLGVDHAVGVASGTDALTLALRAAGVSAGDKVLTSAFSFFATASAIMAIGAEPVFCDIEEETFNLDSERARAVLESDSEVHRRIGVQPGSIRAVVAVHLYGQAADLGRLVELASEFGIALIEDAAQALGSRYGSRCVGSFGQGGCFSFFPTKNLGGFGDGGLVTTGSAEIADLIRRLRAHGSRMRYHHEMAGTNSRLDELQAALLSVRLEELPQMLRARREHAAAYDAELAGLSGLRCPEASTSGSHSYHQYVVRVAGQRDQVRKQLDMAGIDTAVHYPIPMHLQPAVESLGYRSGDLPVAEAAARSVISLPIFPSLTPDERDRVVAALRQVCGDAL